MSGQFLKRTLQMCCKRTCLARETKRMFVAQMIVNHAHLIFVSRNAMEVK